MSQIKLFSYIVKLKFTQSAKGQEKSLGLR